MDGSIVHDIMSFSSFLDNFGSEDWFLDAVLSLEASQKNAVRLIR